MFETLCVCVLHVEMTRNKVLWDMMSVMHKLVRVI